MSYTAIENALLSELCKHLSAGINVVDLIDKLDHLEPGCDIRKDDPILLTTDNLEILERLKEFKYDDLVRTCVASLRIEPRCYDVFLSEVTKDAFDIFVWGFEKLAPTATVEVVDRGFILHTPILIADLILPVISRLHHNILITLEQFLKMLKIANNNPKGFFLNSKTPTPEAQFVDIWVALHLGIPLEPAGSITGEGESFGA